MKFAVFHFDAREKTKLTTLNSVVGSGRERQGNRAFDAN
jgi:hypothetical protein